MNKKIGIDIDDTLGNFSDTLFAYAVEYDKTLRNNGVIQENKYVVDGKFDWTIEEINIFYKKYVELAGHNLIPFKNAKEVIDKLREEGNQVIIISARGRDYKDADKMTNDWLKKYNIVVDKVILGAIDKERIVLKEKIDIFIDDRPSICKKVNEVGVTTYLYSSKYNRDYYLEGIKRIENWNEFYEQIKKEETYEKKYYFRH